MNIPASLTNRHVIKVRDAIQIINQTKIKARYQPTRLFKSFKSALNLVLLSARFAKVNYVN